METVQYKCPNCGANLTFEPESQNFVCAFCDGSFTHEQIEEMYPEIESMKLDIDEPELSPEEKMIQDEFVGSTLLYNCPNCGAGIICEEITASTFCHYCHTPVMLSGRLSGEYKPSKVLPFKTVKEDAIATFRYWCKKKWFVPKAFKSDATLEKIQGIYLPYWLADCNSSGYIRAKCKRVRTWKSGDYTYTNVKEYIAIRNGVMEYRGIPADGSKKADDTLMQNIEPFHYEDLVDFSMSYLSGHSAEKYDVSKQEVEGVIVDRANNNTRQVLKNSIEGYSSVDIVEEQLSVGKALFNYALMPVWFLTYSYAGKTYYYAMNGQTSKVAGQLPVSIPRALVFASILSVILGGLAALGGLFLL